MFRATVPVATVINRVSNFWSGHKLGRENRRFWLLIGQGAFLGSGSYTLTQLFWDYPLGIYTGNLMIFFVEVTPGCVE